MADAFMPPAVLPYGTIIPYVGATSTLGALQNQGWLLCDGTEYLSSDYPNLFAAIGNAFGGSANNYYVPDLRGMFLRGVDMGAGNDPDSGSRNGQSDNLGANTGDEVGTVQADEFAAHYHVFNVNSTGFQITHSGSDWNPPQMGNTNNTDAAGGNETRPKNLYVYYLIYAGQ